ncbi:unnamed protein product, partial [Rotaria magnacalcarata]
NVGISDGLLYFTNSEINRILGLCEHANDLTKQLREKSNYDVINKERILTFDRIAADTQLWRQKLDSYKAAIEERDETIANL